MSRWSAGVGGETARGTWECGRQQRPQAECRLRAQTGWDFKHHPQHHECFRPFIDASWAVLRFRGKQLHAILYGQKVLLLKSYGLADDSVSFFRTIRILEFGLSREAPDKLGNLLAGERRESNACLAARPTGPHAPFAQERSTQDQHGPHRGHVPRMDYG